MPIVLSTDSLSIYPIYLYEIIQILVVGAPGVIITPACTEELGQRGPIAGFEICGEGGVNGVHVFPEMV